LYICSSLKPPESFRLTSLSRLYAIGNCIAAAMEGLVKKGWHQSEHRLTRYGSKHTAGGN
jgi:hypothetical protein